MYASRVDLEQAYGADTVARLAVRADDPTGDVTVAQAIAHAGAAIDARLSVRYLLPLTQAVPILTTIAVDLAIARMAATADLATEEIRRREDKAQAELRAIAEGKMNLGLPARDANDRPHPILSGGGRRLFTRAELRSF